MTKTIALFALLTVVGMAAGDGDSRYAKLDGNKVHYVNFGKGDEAVIFIHGWTCDSTFWKMQAPIYEKRRSVLIDLPGHGLSDKPDISYSMDLFAKAVDAVMVDAHIRKATLVGHSMGTPVAIQFLRLHPDKVAGIVVVDGFVPEPPKDEAAREKALAQFGGMVKVLRSPDYQKTANNMINTMFTKQTDPALKEQIRTKMLAAPQNVMASAMDGMAAMAPLTESYPQLRLTAAMVKRANSAHYQEFLKERFQLVDFQEFDDAGHFLMIESPEKFNALLTKFLDGR